MNSVNVDRNLIWFLILYKIYRIFACITIIHSMPNLENNSGFLYAGPRFLVRHVFLGLNIVG